MRSLTLGTSLAAVLFALGCEDKPPTAPAAARPQFEISDAGHGTGTPGFYFLPPMVAAPTFTGAFVPVVNGQTLPITFRIEDGAILALAVGAIRTWYNTSQGGPSGADAYAGLTLSVMAKSHVAAWNNFNIRFYTGCTDFAFPGYPAGSCGGSSEGTPYPRIEWQNDLSLPQHAQIEWFWYGYYAALSSANDLLRAIGTNGVVITNPRTTQMVETMVSLGQALSMSDIE